jgi:hypothetical protein
MPSTASLSPLPSRLVAMALVPIACASGPSGQLSPSVQKAIVRDDVPALLRALPPPTFVKSGVGAIVAARAAELRSRGWFVEELRGHANREAYDRLRAEREYVIAIPDSRARKSEVDGDFSVTATFDVWRGWSAELGQAFFGSREAFERAVTGRFHRAFSPTRDRVYDVLIFDPSGPSSVIAAGAAFAQGVESVWAALHPRDGRGFSMDVFGMARYVVPAADARLSLGAYTVLQVYESRFFSDFNLLHAEYGRRPARDQYILLALSESELIVVQTVLYDDTIREDLIADLALILGAR